MSRPAALPASGREAGGVGHEAHREVGLGEHLVAAQRRERHLGGRDRPEVVAFEVVGVVGEARQVTGAGHGVGVHQRGRANLLEPVGVAVQGELHQSARQHRALAPEHGEHGPGQLGGALHVQEAHLSGEVPVGDALVAAVVLGGEVLDPQHLVVLGAGAHGAFLGGQVRHPHQQILEAPAQLVGLCRNGPGLVAEHPAVLDGLDGLVPAAVAVQLPDLGGEFLHLVAQLVAPRQQVTPPHVEVERLGQRLGVVAAGRDGGAHPIHLIAQQADVEHHKTVPAQRPGAVSKCGDDALPPRQRCGLILLQAGRPHRGGVAPVVVAVALDEPVVDLLQGRLLPRVWAPRREA